MGNPNSPKEIKLLAARLRTFAIFSAQKAVISVFNSAIAFAPANSPFRFGISAHEVGGQRRGHVAKNPKRHIAPG